MKEKIVYIAIPLIFFFGICYCFWKNFENSKIEYEVVDATTIIDDRQSFYTDRNNGELVTYKQEENKFKGYTTIPTITMKEVPSKDKKISQALSNFSIKNNINARVLLDGYEPFDIMYESVKSGFYIESNTFNTLVKDKVYSNLGYINTEEYFFYARDLLNILTSLKGVVEVTEGESTVQLDGKEVDCYTYKYSTNSAIEDISRTYFIEKDTYKVVKVSSDLGEVYFNEFDVNKMKKIDEFISTSELEESKISSILPYIDIEKYLLTDLNKND